MAIESIKPFDYTANMGLTPPRLDDVGRTKLELPMADGTRIHLEIVRPASTVNLGVILEASPYHGTLTDRSGFRTIPSAVDSDGKQLGLTGYFARRGYAVVMMDLRGTGLSTGCLDHLGSKDQSDLKAVVEWAATQPWSNGRVGMVGHSYVGATAAVAAAQAPRGLATAVVSAGLADMWDHKFQLGVPYWLQWVGPTAGYELIAIERDLPGGAADPVTGGRTGENFGKNPSQTACGSMQSSAATGESELSGVEGAWAAERASGARAAAWPGHYWIVHGVNDNAARIAALRWYYARGGRHGDKTWIGQWDHGIGCCPNRRGTQWTAALHAWFDHELLMRDVATGPAVEVFLNDAPSIRDALSDQGEIFTASAWPPRTELMTLFAAAAGTLGRSAAEAGSLSFAGDPRGFDDPSFTGSIDFRSAPFEHDTAIVGLPRLHLSASVTAPRVHLIANVLDESPEGERRRLSQCAMNPELRGGADHLEAVVPGTRYRLEPPCFTIAHHLRAGHRLTLRISTSDPDKVPIFAVDPNVTVFTGGADGTRLELPVVTAPRLYQDDFRLE